MMTAQEFRALGLALYAGANGWQTAMAERLGVSSRTVRRWASGASPIPAEIEQILKPGENAADWPRDEWITGEGLPSAGDFRREYVVHTRYPRFIARAVTADDDGAAAEDERPADILGGVVYAASEDTAICEIVWIDMPPPEEAKLRALLADAASALFS